MWRVSVLVVGFRYCRSSRGYHVTHRWRYPALSPAVTCAHSHRGVNENEVGPRTHPCFVVTNGLTHTAHARVHLRVRTRTQNSPAKFNTYKHTHTQQRPNRHKHAHNFPELKVVASFLKLILTSVVNQKSWEAFAGSWFQQHNHPDNNRLTTPIKQHQTTETPKKKHNQ